MRFPWSPKPMPESTNWSQHWHEVNGLRAALRKRTDEALAFAEEIVRLRDEIDRINDEWTEKFIEKDEECATWFNQWNNALSHRWNPDFESVHAPLHPSESERKSKEHDLWLKGYADGSRAANREVGV